MIVRLHIIIIIIIIIIILLFCEFFASAEEDGLVNGKSPQVFKTLLGILTDLSCCSLDGLHLSTDIAFKNF